jgi:hypothetical protein
MHITVPRGRRDCDRALQLMITEVSSVVATNVRFRTSQVQVLRLDIVHSRGRKTRRCF